MDEKKSRNQKNQKNVQKYKSENYARVDVTIPRDKKPELKALSDAAGVSLNRYILQAVEKVSGLSLTLDNELPQIKRAREGKAPADPVQDDGTGDQ